VCEQLVPISQFGWNWPRLGKKSESPIGAPIPIPSRSVWITKKKYFLLVFF
jgi:hypothetical protein